LAPEDLLQYNQLSDPILAEAFGHLLFHKAVVMSKMFIHPEDRTASLTASTVRTENGIPLPFAQIYYPVHNPDFTRIVGSVGAALRMDRILQSVVPPYSDLVDVVIENSCDQVVTYKVSPVSNTLQYVGHGDLHDIKYDHMFWSSSFEDFKRNVDLISPGVLTGSADTTSDGYCKYRFLVYPTADLEQKYKSNEPYVYALLVFAIFVFTSLVFIIYDCMVRRRQQKVMTSAKRTNDIVASLYPANVRSRLFQISDSHSQVEGKLHRKPRTSSFGANRECKSAESLNATEIKETPTSIYGSAPIADLFPSTTVFFLDIAGFTAWSSEREPAQVSTKSKNHEVCNCCLNKNLSFSIACRTIGLYAVGRGLQCF
jgi:hypothetical protein